MFNGFGLRSLLLTVLTILFPFVTRSQSISSLTLAPFGYVGNIGAYCTDTNGNFVPYCTPAIGNGYYQYSGGHLHDDPSHINYSGTVATNGQQNTDVVSLAVSYYASRTGEWEYMSSCADTCSYIDVFVEYPLSQTQLGNTANLTLVGSTIAHPNNHYGDPNTLAAVVAITNQYADDYSTEEKYQVVGVNDMAISFGGVFDICALPGACAGGKLTPWQSPHIYHDNGFAVDFRANKNPNSVLPAAYNDFVGYCKANGLGRLPFLEAPGTSNQHIHCDCSNGHSSPVKLRPCFAAR